MSRRSTPTSKPPTCKFSPIVSDSPRRALSETARAVKTIITNIRDVIEKWNKNQERGSAIVQQICTVKTGDMTGFTAPLESLTNQLYELVQELTGYRDKLQELSKRAAALARLRPPEEKLFSLMDMKHAVEYIESVVESYCKELEVKRYIVENIAEASDRENVMFFAARWTYQCHISAEIKINYNALLTAANVIKKDGGLNKT